jgi:MFS family permease
VGGADERTGATGYVALLRNNSSYRNLWLGQVVSLLGDWFNLVATATLVQQLTGSSAQVGLLFALRMLAPFLVSPFAGVVADRFDRRRVLIATDLLRAAVVLGFVLVPLC